MSRHAKKRKPQQPPCDLMLTIGEIARDTRVAHGWTQEEVAEAADSSVAMVSSAERGKRCVSIEGLEKLAKALGVTAAELCGGRP